MIARGADPEPLAISASAEDETTKADTEGEQPTGAEPSELTSRPDQSIDVKSAAAELNTPQAGVEMPLVQAAQTSRSDYMDEWFMDRPKRNLWDDFIIGHHDKSAAIGVYLAGGASPSHGGGGGEAGFIGDMGRWYGRLGLAGTVSTATDDGYVGPTLGFGVQARTRVSPFVGVSTFVGYSGDTKLADDDDIDNDFDGRVDERGETRLNFEELLVTVAPEFGVRYWITEAMQMSTYASYNVTNLGREHDYWTVGLRLALYSR